MARARSNAFRKLIVPFIGFLICPLAALAIDLDAKLEPGIAGPLGPPQNNQFGLGGAATLKALLGDEGSYVNLAAGITFVALSTQTNNSDPGTAWAPSIGIRIQRPRESEEMRLARPHGLESSFGVRPWLDADVLYVSTGDLNRLGFAAAVGLSFPVGEARLFWMGPFVRYFQIQQGVRAGYDNGAARTLIVGLSFELGARFARRPPPLVEPAPVAMAVAVIEPPPAPICLPPEPLSDRDGDGLPDIYDDCPDLAGPRSNGGCPVYKTLIVRTDRLELKEKIQFTWNDSILDPVSYPTLDEVATVLRDNKRLRVAVEGHASSEGGDEHNQSLSSRRAESVLAYLVGHGVARERLVSKGFSSSMPIESNKTEEGREANRRVEFVVHFVIISNDGKLP